MKRVTCTGPVNIAVIKYWGKRDEDLILPINSSLSITLDQAHLRAKTTIATSPEFTEDRIWLNKEEQPIQTKRLQTVLKAIRERAKQQKGDQNRLDWCVRICSENNFPTAAGLASSAAGYACLVYSLAELFDLEGDVSDIARLGSGSACRSIYGGFVAWDKGSRDDGSDSIARHIAPESHMSDLRVLLLVVSSSKKHVASTEGMQTSVQTSELLQHRSNHIVPRRMKIMTQAILEQDYKTFAEETMKDSNQMHAVCLDTYPPVSYMTDTSREIVRAVHTINKFYNDIKVAYTFDAGANACLYLPQASVAMMMGVLQYLYPPKENGEPFVRGLPVNCEPPCEELLATLPVSPNPGALQYIIYTQAGPGPQKLDDSQSLLDDHGLPILLT